MQSVEEMLADWKREMPELSTSAFAPILRALHFSSLVGRFELRVLEAFEIGPNEYEALSVLRRAGSPYRLNARLLASRTGISSGGLTKMLKRLEKQGLVAREPDPEDGRGTRVALTRRGRELQERVLRAFVLAAENRLEALSDDERVEYDRSLRLWSEALEH